MSEVKGNVTRTYTYDNAGNITAISSTTSVPGFGSNSKPTSVSVTKNLSYSNSEWGDLLTSFDGHTITYDGIGNPLSYYNGSSYTFTWEGRRLVGAVKGSKTMSFEYNDEGIRTSKTVNGVETTYYVNGGQIVAESNNSRTIIYIYDASGSPIGMLYRTPSYAANTFDVFWYEKNLQGDIVAVYDSTGTKLVSYNYTDAWGNHSISYSNGGASTGAAYNPFHYRGYYYDGDLGMYYLQSRYYDAKICRFISADYASITAATPYALTDKNLYAYCDNNPVVRSDESGEFWHIIASAIVGGLLSGKISSIDQLQSDGEVDWTIVGISVAAGALSGALATVGAPPVANLFIQFFGNALISAGESMAIQTIKSGSENIVWSDVISNAFIGGITSVGNGISVGDSNHLMRHGIKATKNLRNKGLAKTVKFYFSQTKTLFYKPLVKNSLQELADATIKSVVKNSIK